MGCCGGMAREEHPNERCTAIWKTLVVYDSTWTCASLTLCVMGVELSRCGGVVGAAVRDVSMCAGDRV